MHSIDQLQAAVIALKLSNKIPSPLEINTTGPVPKKSDVNKKDESESTYENALKNLTKILADQKGNKIVGTPQAFYKEGNPHIPAGYVIESEKEIMVVYHGTQTKNMKGGGWSEVGDDLKFWGNKMKAGEVEGNVHAGFLNQYNKSKDSLYEILGPLKEAGKPLHFAGHSLGGAVAQIAALDAKTNNPNSNKLDVESNSDTKWEVSAVSTFGSPRVFFSKLADVYDRAKLSENTVRVIESRDVIASLNLKRTSLRHVGYKIVVKSESSKGIRKAHKQSTYRDLVQKMKDQKKVTITMPRKREASLRNFTTSIMKMTKEVFNEMLKEAKRAYIEGGSQKFVNDMKKSFAPSANLPRKSSLSEKYR